jgi:DNA-binding GntR family transcriptional regulator
MSKTVRNCPSAGRAAPSDQDIHARIFDAILSRRLPPGAHLGETQLAELFGVSRTKVRQALTRLAQDGVVEHRRNQGAHVTIPSAAQTRHIFEVRHMLEPAVAASLATHLKPAGLKRLRQHMAAEQAAQGQDEDDASRREAELIRLTGVFHLLLAELHGNPLILRALRDLEALSCLAILHYAPVNAATCLLHEHAAIVEALAAGNSNHVAALMATHLDHVAEQLTVPAAAAPDWDLGRALATSPPAKPKRRTKAP